MKSLKNLSVIPENISRAVLLKILVEPLKESREIFERILEEPLRGIPGEILESNIEGIPREKISRTVLEEMSGKIPEEKSQE